MKPGFDRLTDIWHTIRVLSDDYGWFTARSVQAVVCARGPTVVIGYLQFLQDEQIIVQDKSAPRAASRVCYRLQRDGDIAPPWRDPRSARIERACWTAMRALKTFTGRELAAAASTEGHEIPRNKASYYAECLLTAGILVEAEPSKTARIFRLPAARDTGPSAPVWMAERKAAYDLNAMQIRRRGA